MSSCFEWQITHPKLILLRSLLGGKGLPKAAAQSRSCLNMATASACESCCSWLLMSLAEGEQVWEPKKWSQCNYIYIHIYVCKWSSCHVLFTVKHPYHSPCSRGLAGGGQKCHIVFVWSPLFGLPLWFSKARIAQRGRRPNSPQSLGHHLWSARRGERGALASAWPEHEKFRIQKSTTP